MAEATVSMESMAPVEEITKVDQNSSIEVDTGTNYSKLQRTAEKTYKEAQKNAIEKSDAMTDDMVYAEQSAIQSAMNGQWPSYADIKKLVDAETQHKASALKAELKGAWDILVSAKNVAKTNIETGFGEAGLDIHEGLAGEGIQKVGSSLVQGGVAALATSVGLNAFKEDMDYNEAQAAARGENADSEDYSDFAESNSSPLNSSDPQIADSNETEQEQQQQSAGYSYPG